MAEQPNGPVQGMLDNEVVDLAAGIARPPDDQQQCRRVCLPHRGHRHEQESMALLVLLATDRDEHRRLDRDGLLTTNRRPALGSWHTENSAIPAPLDDCDLLPGNTQMLHGRGFGGVADGMEVGGEQPAGEAVDEPNRRQPPGLDSGIERARGVVTSVHEATHHRHPGTDGC